MIIPQPTDNNMTFDCGQSPKKKAKSINGIDDKLLFNNVIFLIPYINVNIEFLSKTNSK